MPTSTLDQAIAAAQTAEANYNGANQAVVQAQAALVTSQQQLGTAGAAYNAALQALSQAALAAQVVVAN